jgi:hypothetical protein
MDGPPATKHDLAGLEQRMDARFGEVNAKLDQVDARFDQLRDELKESILDVETRILTAIYGSTETMSLRQDGAARKAAEFEDRLMVMECRVLELEKRLNLPPGQAA